MSIKNINIVKIGDQYGVRITSYDKNRLKKQTYSLRRLLIGGLTTLSLLTAIGLLATKNERSYQREAKVVEAMLEVADQMQDEIIQVGGKENNIGEEIREYVEAKEELNEAKKLGNEEMIERSEQEVNEEKKQIFDIAKQQVKNAAEQYFPEEENAHLELYRPDNNQDLSYFVNQVEGGNFIFDREGKVINSFELQNDYAQTVIDGHDADKIVTEMPDFLEDGLEQKGNKLK